MPAEIVVSLIEKLSILAVGVVFGAMSYRLLHSGLYEHAERVKAASEPVDLLWKQVLPGAVFALFAGVIVVVGLRQPPVLMAVADSQSSERSDGEPELIAPAPVLELEVEAEAGSGLIGHPLDPPSMEIQQRVEAGSVLSLQEW